MEIWKCGGSVFWREHPRGAGFAVESDASTPTGYGGERRGKQFAVSHPGRQKSKDRFGVIQVSFQVGPQGGPMGRSPQN